MFAQGPAGGVGFGLMFLTTLSACLILGVCTLAYAARCLRVVLQGTAAGLDEVPWPEESFLDWLWEAFHLLGLMALCLVPPGIAARSLRHDWLIDDDLLRLAVLAVPTFWSLFPVMVLSALSGENSWAIFRPTIIGGLFRLFWGTLAFYILTAFVLASAVAAWYGVYVEGILLLLPLAAVLSGAAVLIYARLLGRLGQLIAHLPARPKRRPQLPQRRPGRLKPLEVRDPWAIPNELIQEPPRPPEPGPRPAWSPPRPDEIEPYQIAMEAPKPPRPRRKRRGVAPQTPEEVERSGLGNPPANHQSAGRQRPTEATDHRPPPNAPPQTKESMAATSDGRTADPPPPAHPFLTGVWSFPVYFHCRSHWFGLSFMALVVGGLGALLQTLFAHLQLS
jgi:hypothetical protein